MHEGLTKIEVEKDGDTYTVDSIKIQVGSVDVTAKRHVNEQVGSRNVRSVLSISASGSTLEEALQNLAAPAT